MILFGTKKAQSKAINLIMTRAIGSVIRGFGYWLLTAGPVGITVGTLLRHRAFDRLGPISVPRGTKPDIIGGIAFGIYEYPERVLIERWLPTDADCIELGCSIGVISRIILQKLQTDYQLIAVEASADLVNLAEINIAAAGFSSRFKSVHSAVHYHGDHVIFEEHEEHIRGRVATQEKAGGIAIPCTTLSRVLKNNFLGAYSLVMDIEGSEFDVITKDSESLVNCQAIIAEIHGDTKSKSDFVENIEGMGFKLAEIKHAVFAFVRH
jgi:FkbM family methyltransferase